MEVDVSMFACTGLMMCRQLQRGVQALHEDRSKMQVTIEATTNRVGQLEHALAKSQDQIASLTSLVSNLLASDKHQVTNVLNNGFMPGGSGRGEPEAGPGSGNPVSFEPTNRRVDAAPAGLASQSEPLASVIRVAAGAGGDDGAGALASTEHVKNMGQKGSTALPASAQGMGNLATLSPGGGSPEAGIERPQPAPIGSSLQPGQDALGEILFCIAQDHVHVDHLLTSFVLQAFQRAIPVPKLA